MRSRERTTSATVRTTGATMSIPMPSPIHHTNQRAQNLASAPWPSASAPNTEVKPLLTTAAPSTMPPTSRSVPRVKCRLMSGPMSHAATADSRVFAAAPASASAVDPPWRTSARKLPANAATRISGQSRLSDSSSAASSRPLGSHGDVRGLDRERITDGRGGEVGRPDEQCARHPAAEAGGGGAALLLGRRALRWHRPKKPAATPASS